MISVVPALSDRRSPIQWVRRSRFFACVIVGLVVLSPFRLLELACVGSRPSRISMLYHRLLARGLGIHIDVIGAPLSPNALIVANHISWVDVIMLGARMPATFVAKADVKAWPFLGALARLNPTIFVERGQRHTIARQIGTLRDALARGCVALFPEGTTGNGADVLPFRPALLEAAVGRYVQPLTIRYLPSDRDTWRQGELAAFAWDGDKPFWSHLLNVIGGQGPRCQLIVHPSFILSAADRKLAAARSRAAIETALRTAVQHSTPGRLA